MQQDRTEIALIVRRRLNLITSRLRAAFAAYWQDTGRTGEREQWWFTGFYNEMVSFTIFSLMICSLQLAPSLDTAGDCHDLRYSCTCPFHRA